MIGISRLLIMLLFFFSANYCFSQQNIKPVTQIENSCLKNLEPFCDRPTSIFYNKNTVNVDQLEQEAIEREKADLLAQQGMNNATQEMNVATQAISKYTYYSLILSGAGLLITGLGTIFIVYSLYLTMQATKATLKSVELSDRAIILNREIAEMQSRAYLASDGPNIHLVLHSDDDRNFTFKYTPRVRNYGASPAICTGSFSRIYTFPAEELPPVLNVQFDDYGPDRVVCGSGSSIYLMTSNLTPDIIDETFNGRLRMFVFVQVTYKDVFWSTDKLHVFELCEEIFFNTPSEYFRKNEKAVSNLFWQKNYTSFNIEICSRKNMVS